MEKMQLPTSEAPPAGQSELRIARRTPAISTVATPRSGAGDSAADLPSVRIHPGAGPVRTPLPQASRPTDPVPIWLAALVASSCEARRNGENHAVRWNWVSGRALYTNLGRDTEHIEPLGVHLLGGHTMAVYWLPGETAYTVEVYRQAELCA